MNNSLQIDFREGMSRLAGAVTIVTTDGKHGKGGITATAICSVSDAPPTLLVCVNNGNDLNPLIKANQLFSVNLLGEQHQELANRFAGFVKGITMPERFLEGDWGILHTGAPILQNSIASFDCRLRGFQEVGSHTVIFGEVQTVVIREAQSPLLYFQRGYTTVAP